MIASKDKQELQKALTDIRTLARELRVEALTLPRRPRQQKEAQADRALGIAYIIEHQLERLEGRQP